MSNSKCKRYRLRFNRRSDNGIETTYIPFGEINDAFVIVVNHINEKLLKRDSSPMENISVEVYRSELDKWVNLDDALWS